jgi:NitT/TauT family transport system substrate-binding protein
MVVRESNMADLVRVAHSGSGVYYAPDYLALEMGFFAEEGLQVEAEIPGGTPLARYLSSGHADIALGGIWRPLMYRNRLETLVAFAMLCTRNAQVLVARTAPVGDGFNWTSLHGKSVILPTGAPSPWMFLSGILKKSGADLSKVLFIRDLEGEETTRLFRAGLGDFYLTMPPLSEELVAEGYHVAVTLAEAGGAVPWSVYYATPEFLTRERRVAHRFAKAIKRALCWLLAHETSEMTGPLRSHFPATDAKLLARSIALARQRGVWTDSVRIPEGDLFRWQETMVQYGLIDRPLPYLEVVDPGPADATEAEPAGCPMCA